jgi:hypothetical protein
MGGLVTGKKDQDGQQGIPDFCHFDVGLPAN